MTELDKDALKAARKALYKAVQDEACVDIAETAIRAYLAVADGWRPIETALRDRFINLYCPEDKSIWWAKWQSGEWYGVDEIGITRSGGYAVTRWRPPPSPPKDG